ncbi:MAG: aminopeptidase P family protein [Candidatus Odinarchaeota archaeon]|nr:aminopeptidase P family protein [Candidatus Odinarchaeota archaeon]
MRGHIERVREVLESKKIDAIVILNYPFIDKMFFYLTDLQSGIFEGSFIILTRDDIVLYTSKLEEKTARKQVKFEVKTIENKIIDVLKKELSKFKKVGLNLSILPVKTYNQLEGVAEFVDVSKELMDIRSIKDDKEIARIKKAIKISELALKETIETIDIRKMTELEIAAELEYRCRKNGAEGFAFETIVAADENSADPHYKTGNNNKKPTRILLIDFGVKYKGYVSDITRTFLIGKPDDKLKKMYEIAYDAQQKALNVIRDGVEAKYVDAQARELIVKHYGEFIHGLGHMIGLDVHEGYSLNQKADWILKENQVFTVEPGIYIQGFGGVRIEDDVVVRKDGVEILSSFPKKIDEMIL